MLDVLKCKDEVFSILRKLIRQSCGRLSQSCSQSVQEAIIVDATVSVTVSAWGNLNKMKQNFTLTKLSHDGYETGRF